MHLLMRVAAQAPVMHEVMLRCAGLWTFSRHFLTSNQPPGFEKQGPQQSRHQMSLEMPGSQSQRERDTHTSVTSESNELIID